MRERAQEGDISLLVVTAMTNVETM